MPISIDQHTLAVASYRNQRCAHRSVHCRSRACGGDKRPRVRGELHRRRARPNLTSAEIATVIALNEIALGIDIELIAKVTPGGAIDQVQPGFEGIAFESFACTPAASDCQTGFTLTLAFSAVAGGPFQIVKLAVKAGDNLVGVFSLQDQADLQSGDLDVIQAAFVSSLERSESCGSPGGPSGCRGVSNIYVFGAPADVTNPQQQVPEPATLTLLGLGVVAGAVAARRKHPKP